MISIAYDYEVGMFTMELRANSLAVEHGFLIHV